jgi:hypothetical protein
MKKIVLIGSLLLLATLACSSLNNLEPTVTDSSKPLPTSDATIEVNTNNDSLEATNAATVTPGITPIGNVEEIFTVTSIGSAHNGAAPTTFSVTEPWLVTEIKTYHWNNGNGAAPGTIGLMASDGTDLGTWQADGLPGSGGVTNAYWVINPNIVIPAGTYTVIDSDPGTWAQNSETNGVGMAWGLGVRQ